MSALGAQEPFISVDVETAGPAAGIHPLLSIGACTLATPQQTFYIELQPDSGEFLPRALAVSGLSLEQLAQSGLPPGEAMARFASWLGQVVPAGQTPVFVALNAPFDWSFINYYFHRYLGHNPFGHSALDMKALFMGLRRAPWHQTHLEAQVAHFNLSLRLTHHALQDALDQARVFQRLMADFDTPATPLSPQKETE